MEFLQRLQRADESELQRLLLSKMTHLNERIANPPESIVDQILQIASWKIQVSFSLFLSASLSVCLPLSLFVSVYLSLSISLSISLFLLYLLPMKLIH
jgi:hypothetical protein